jgi:hypothetical protein
MESSFAIYTMVTLFMRVTLHIQRLYILGQMETFSFGPIDLNFLVGLVLLMHGEVVLLFGFPVSFTKLRVHDAVGMFIFVFLPK